MEDREIFKGYHVGDAFLDEETGERIILSMRVMISNKNRIGIRAAEITRIPQMHPLERISLMPIHFKKEPDGTYLGFIPEGQQDGG